MRKTWLPTLQKTPSLNQSRSQLLSTAVVLSRGINAEGRRGVVTMGIFNTHLATTASARGSDTAGGETT